MDKIKRCPFCGGIAKTFHNPANTEEERNLHPSWKWRHPNTWVIGCSSDFCNCDNTEGFCYLHDEFPPYTNADKIRDMNDEELAKFLMSEWFAKDVCKNCDGEYDRCGDIEFCTKKILKRLKKTAE